MTIVDKIVRKCMDLELVGLKPSVAVIGGENVKELKTHMLSLAGSDFSIVDSTYRVNVAGNTITIIETKDEFLEVYSNEKIQ